VSILSVALERSCSVELRKNASRRSGFSLTSCGEPGRTAACTLTYKCVIQSASAPSAAPPHANVFDKVKTMDKDFKRLTDFLVGMGVEQVPHTHKSYLAHLIAVFRSLESVGCSEDVCRAGMFHSIYGTERFQGFTLPLERRGEVRTLIGDRAERLAYLNCAMDRVSLDRVLDQVDEPYRITDRITGEEVQLSQRDFDDLCRVHLLDWLEQVPRSQEWDYRRAAYQGMARRLGGPAEEQYERLFAQEKAASGPGF
jgi:hypothetical protein